MILKNQKAIFDRAGLGFRCYAKQKSVNNLYKKSTNENMIYFYYEKSGHKLYIYKSKRNIKQIWVIKRYVLTNNEGPKKAWVPKNT